MASISSRLLLLLLLDLKVHSTASGADLLMISPFSMFIGSIAFLTKATVTSQDAR